MRIKVHHNQNTLSVLEFSIYTQFDQNKYDFKIFGKEKIVKGSTGFELIPYRFVVNALTYCATLMGNNLEVEKNI